MNESLISELTRTTEFRLKLFPQNFYLVKDFYEKTLGYPIVTGWDEEHTKGVMFNTGSGIIELLTPEKDYQPIEGANVSLKVTDVWQLWEQLKNYPSISKPISANSWGDTSFRILDPEGFQITFFSTTR